MLFLPPKNCRGVEVVRRAEFENDAQTVSEKLVRLRAGSATLTTSAPKCVKVILVGNRLLSEPGSDLGRNL